MIALSQEQLKTWTPPLGAVVITDLDECTIDSDHRRSFHDYDGELDIPAWHIHSQPELIALDQLRPWGERFAALKQERLDCQFGICTSREFTDADYIYMQKHFDIARISGMIWHRETGCEQSRESLKHRLFVENITNDRYLLDNCKRGKVYFFDDKVKNVLAAEELGINGILVY